MSCIASANDHWPLNSKMEYTTIRLMNKTINCVFWPPVEFTLQCVKTMCENFPIIIKFTGNQTVKLLEFKILKTNITFVSYFIFERYLMRLVFKLKQFFILEKNQCLIQSVWNEPKLNVPNLKIAHLEPQYFWFICWSISW